MDVIHTFAWKRDLRLVDLNPQLEQEHFRWDRRSYDSNAIMLQLLTKNKQHQLTFVTMEANRPASVPFDLLIKEKLSHDSCLIIALDKSIHLKMDEINEKKLQQIFDRSTDCCICEKTCQNSNIMFRDIQCRYCTTKICYDCIVAIVTTHQNDRFYKHHCPICREPHTDIDMFISMFKAHERFLAKMSKEERESLDARAAMEMEAYK